MKDPYAVWLSEIIMQQTRVKFGAHYFQKFITAFPTVRELALAPEEEVFRLWQGLGYYNRCKNLIATAKEIYFNLNGLFPNTYEKILRLKGVGPYTAAAISSFAFDLPYAVVDGNVLRILSRFYGIKTPIDSTKGKKEFAVIAQNLLNKKVPAHYNQAIMDFGAVICKPGTPSCDVCVLKARCVAYKTNTAPQLPVKEKKQKIKSRFFNFIVFENKTFTYMEKRVKKDIWQNLYQFPLIESDRLLNNDEITIHSSFQKLIPHAKANFKHSFDQKPQKLTHQEIHARFFHFQIDYQPLKRGIIPVNAEKLSTLPLPKIIASYLKD